MIICQNKREYKRARKSARARAHTHTQMCKNNQFKVNYNRRLVSTAFPANENELK